MSVKVSKLVLAQLTTMRLQGDLPGEWLAVVEVTENGCDEVEQAVRAIFKIKKHTEGALNHQLFLLRRLRELYPKTDPKRIAINDEIANLIEDETNG